MKTRDYFLIPVFLVAVLAIIISLLMGVQYVASLVLDFKFTSIYSSIFLSIGIIIGFILLIPISIVLESFALHIGMKNKGIYFLIQIIQFTLFLFYMDLMVSNFSLVQFSDIANKFIYFTITYGFVYIFAKIGDLIKKSDEAIQQVQ
ncbi:hypothetical protein [Lysinibacillus sp. G4S2]|uniref:hypothetical protein n=1 Tax=Lysinibacillus sp. G4S2 TaxID=3055859 RepID=UPI0025A03C0F|nr:hypothetical protein [Lysinibacillus sp. G4S2]MDM5248216.1 hypothetical protein [Lysinibacillus sp. G4S2]